MEIPVTYMTMILTIMIARIFFIRFNGDFDILSYESFSMAVYTDIKSDTLLLLQIKYATITATNFDNYLYHINIMNL